VPDIFVSYASEDRGLASEVAALLEENGYSVWWDRELVAGQQFYDTISGALKDCRAAIVIWTTSSIKSRWVLGEADTAATAQKLIPVRADDLPASDIPIAFRVLHTNTLSDHKGLLSAIRLHLAATPKAMSRRQVYSLRAQRRLNTVTRWLTLRHVVVTAVVVLVVGYCAALVTDWLQIRNSVEPYDFERYLSHFPFSPFAGQARAKLGGVNEWQQQKIEISNNPTELQNFIDKYPGSLYEGFVRIRISRLDAVASGRYTPVLRSSLSAAIGSPELEALTCEKLWTARNEIFYVLGYCFVSDTASAAFHTAAECPKDCKAIQKFNSMITDEIESDIQKSNINAIVALEKQKGCHIIQVGNACARP
jgi:hypothetical protein